MNIVAGFCDYCKSVMTYESLTRHKNCLLCLDCFQKGNSKLLILLIHTGCPRKNGQNFGRVFLMLKYTDITQNTNIQS